LVHLTSSHIGSFFSLATTLDPEASLTLVNWDAHDDALALTQSRVIRRTLWKKGRVDLNRLNEMDQGQFVEGYNWIEPLMPQPLRRVIWVRPGKPSDLEDLRITEGLQREVRLAGSPALDWSWNDEVGWEPPGEAWVLSIDLDVLSRDPGGRAERLSRFLSQAATRPPVVVTACVSAPYLEASEPGPLVRELLEALLAVTDWTISVDPRVSWGGRDRGQERRLGAEGRQWHEYDARDDGLESWIAAHGQGRIMLSPSNRSPN